MKNIKVAIPSPSEQTAIAAFLDDKTTKIDRVIAQKQQMIALLKERKQIIIQNAVTKGLNYDSYDDFDCSDAPNNNHSPSSNHKKSKFRRMKDSGVEWIGEIPEHWEVIALNYVIDAIGDVDHYMPPTIDNGITYLMTGDLKEFASHIDFDGCKKVSFRDYSNLTKKIKTEMGDVILARYATIGTSTYVDVDTNFLVSYSCVTIKPKKSKLFGLFLFYYFKTNAFANDIRNQVNTNTQGNVGIGDLKKVKLILPAFQEQTTIVAHIEAQSTKIDQAIQLQAQQIEKLKELKATLIDGAVTGKIRVSEL